jgi:hypothetical protein
MRMLQIIHEYYELYKSNFKSNFNSLNLFVVFAYNS